MIIEELAFKDRKNLTQLNEKDLLDIIEFLQDDRKQWINQFSKIHNEDVDIKEQNKRLSEQLELLISKLDEYDLIVDERNQLKKQLEEYIKTNLKLKNELFNKRKEYQDTYKDVRIEIKEYKTQQKEFVKWLKKKQSLLRDEISELTLGMCNTDFQDIKIEVYQEVLQKYEEIIGGKE